MYRRFTDLKKHYGTETMLEVILDPVLRAELTDRPLYKDGKLLRMSYNQRDGLLAYDFNTMLIPVVRKVNEAYLERLMISTVDFKMIVNGDVTYKNIIDLEEYVEAIEVKEEPFDTNRNLAYALLSGIVVVCSMIILNRDDTVVTPVTPKSKRR